MQFCAYHRYQDEEQPCDECVTDPARTDEEAEMEHARLHRLAPHLDVDGEDFQRLYTRMLTVKALRWRPKVFRHGTARD